MRLPLIEWIGFKFGRVPKIALPLIESEGTAYLTQEESEWYGYGGQQNLDNYGVYPTKFSRIAWLSLNLREPYDKIESQS